ncbi:MAG: tyrosine-protein phosphatase [Candidatus Latescibacterota bacterium]|nr:MAG: tyrosine-protein phosphatase [Candidatus Latescibacterota bacterium]
MRARHVPLTGQPNFRDLGGYRTADGRTVKWREVYRSGQLGQLTEEDVAALQKLELRTVVNFLLPDEIEKHGADRLPDHTLSVAQPINSERAATFTRQVQQSIQTANFEAIPPELNPEFHRILLDDGKKQYAALLRAVSDPANRPLAFHCSHGVHRTGTATAILLSALGVPWETIRADYLLSNEYRDEEVEKQLRQVRKLAADKQGISPEELDMTNVEAFYVLDGSYIDGALERAVETFGSLDGYIRNGLGLTDEEVERLRDQLLESPNRQ